MRITTATLAATLLLAGCGSALPGYPAPPPLPAERIPLPPVSEDSLVLAPWRLGLRRRFLPL